MYYRGRPESKTCFRFHMSELLDSARKDLLEVGTQRLKCCHTGGSICVRQQRQSLHVHRDNRIPRQRLRPIDERPAACRGTRRNRRKYKRCVGRSSASTRADGTYTIPTEISFEGMAKTRPRSTRWAPQSLSSHCRLDTGSYWGDGPQRRDPPDADRVATTKSPASNAAITAGPTCAHQAYYKVTWVDSATVIAGAQLDPRTRSIAHPNTGVTTPPARALTSVSVAPSPEFPIVGSGGRASAAGPVFHRDDSRQRG